MAKKVSQRGPRSPRSGGFFPPLAAPAALCALLPAAPQTWGEVLSEQEISASQGGAGGGGFGGVLLPADRFAGRLEGIGDLDGDGSPDLVAGTIGDLDTGPDNGAVWVLFLDAQAKVKATGGFTKISDAAGGVPGSNWGNDAPLGNLDDYSRFGFDIASLGDLDGPGGTATAIAVSAPGTVGKLMHGSVWILFLDQQGQVVKHTEISDGVGGLPSGSIGTDDQFGSGLAALGKLDPFDQQYAIDLAVGERFRDDGNTDSGAVWILSLRSDGTVKKSGLISNTAGGRTGSRWGNQAPGGTGILGLDDRFGHSVTSLGTWIDANHGTRCRGVIAVGAYHRDVGAQPGEKWMGAVFVMFLDASGQVLSFVEVSRGHGGLGNPLRSGDRFGSDVECHGDLSTTGNAVLYVGANQDDDGGTNQGAVYVLALGDDGRVTTLKKISAISGNFGGRLDAQDRFGVGIGYLGDVDGQGAGEMAVGTGEDPVTGNSDNRFWVLQIKD